MDITFLNFKGCLFMFGNFSRTCIDQSRLDYTINSYLGETLINIGAKYHWYVTKLGLEGKFDGGNTYNPPKSLPSGLHCIYHIFLYA